MVASLHVFVKKGFQERYQSIQFGSRTTPQVPLPGCTVNSEIFARILFSRIALKVIFAMLKIRDYGMIYLYQ